MSGLNLLTSLIHADSKKISEKNSEKISEKNSEKMPDCFDDISLIQLLFEKYLKEKCWLDTY